MENLLDPATFQAIAEETWTWLRTNILNFGSAGQLGAIAVSLGLACLAAPRFRHTIDRLAARLGPRFLRASDVLRRHAIPLLWLVLVWACSIVAAELAWPFRLTTIASNLLAAWLVIHLLTVVIRDGAVSRLVSTGIWTVAALNILNLLGPTVAALDRLAFNFGELRLSALTVAKGVIALAVLLWVATILSRMLERRIVQLPNLTPSVQVLLVKLLKIVLVVIAVIAAVSTVGIDLTAFAVFGGAVGVGLGLGLQRSVSNLISGLMILFDRSIKPGDVIEVAGTYGWVNSLGGRYTSVVTRDGIEHLIPNDELIGQRVANWSYSSNEVRLRASVGISYSADPRQAIALCVEAARECSRVLETPGPVCLLKEFGDSAINLELRFWINDPRNGVSNVRSDVLLRIWDKLRAHDIEIPHPQRDRHPKSAEPLPASPTAAAE